VLPLLFSCGPHVGGPRQTDHATGRGASAYMQWRPENLIYLAPNGRSIVLQRPAGKPHIVGHVGGSGTLDVTGARDHVYWLEDHGLKTSIVGVTSKTGKKRVIVPPTSREIDAVVALRQTLFVATSTGIGRVDSVSGDARWDYLRLPGDGVGPVGDGLATDGRSIYVSQCFHNRVGRITVGPRPRISWLTGLSCPKSIAIGGGYLYWSPGPRQIARVALSTGRMQAPWLRLRNTPVGLAYAGSFLYWTWSSPLATSKGTYVSRIDTGLRRPTIRWHQAADTPISGF